MNVSAGSSKRRSHIARAAGGLAWLGLALTLVPEARADAPTLVLPKSLATPTCFVRRAEAGGGVSVLTLAREEEYHGRTPASLYLDPLDAGAGETVVDFDLEASAPSDSVLALVGPQRLAELARRYDPTQPCAVSPLAVGDRGEADFDVGGVKHHLRRDSGWVVRLDDGREVKLRWTSDSPRWVVVHDDQVGILTSKDGVSVSRPVLGYRLSDFKAPSPPPPPVPVGPPVVPPPIRHITVGPPPSTSQERCLGWDSKARALWVVHRPDACVDAGGEECPDESRLERVGPGRALTVLLGARGVGGAIDEEGAARADKALKTIDLGCVASDLGSPVVNGVTVDVKVDGNGHVVVSAGSKTLDLGAIDVADEAATTREGLGPTFWNPNLSALVVEVQRTSDRGDSQRYVYADLKALGVH